MIDNHIKFSPLTQNSNCCPVPPNIDNRTLLYENKSLSSASFPSLLNSQFLIQQNNGSIPHFPKLFGNQYNYRNPSFLLPKLLYEYKRQELINQLSTVKKKYQSNFNFNSIFGLNNINGAFNKIINDKKLQSVLNKNTENIKLKEIDDLFDLDKKVLAYFNDINIKEKKKNTKSNIIKNFKGSNSLYNLNINIGYNLNNIKESLQDQKNSISIIKNNEDIENKNTLFENKFEQNIKQNENQKNEVVKNTNEALINEKTPENKSTTSSQNSPTIFSFSTTSEKSTNTEPEEETSQKNKIPKNPGEKLFVCKYPNCEKSFNQNENLKKHEKLHSNNKKFICSFPNCGKKFSENSNLKIHYHCHNDERPYKCNFPNCGKSFNDKGNLKFHEKSAHEIQNESPSSSELTICIDSFEEKKEKSDQDCQMDIDCLNERKELAKLIQKYKNILFEIILNKKIDNEEDEDVLTLKKKFEDVQEKLIDGELFEHYDNLEDKCSDLKDKEIVENEI